MLDNNKRKELLSKARQSGFPGSILDVFTAYEQGRDLIAEYQQEQRVKQAQQMSDFVASQTLQPTSPLPQQQPQQQLPSSPPIVQANVPVQMPEQQQPLVDSSRSTNVGIVPNQTGSYKGEAIFAKGGFKTDPPKDYPKATPPPAWMPIHTVNPVEVKANRFNYNIDPSKYPDLGLNQPLPNFRPVKNPTLDEIIYWNQVPDFYKKWGKDDITENVLEFLDPTGILSHDDARRAYESWKASGREKPTSSEALDMFGAVPGLGRIGKVRYVQEAVKPITRYIPWQQILNALDFGQDITENKNIDIRIPEDKKYDLPSFEDVEVDTNKNAEKTSKEGTPERKPVKVKFATGGFKEEGPGCPEGYFKDINGNCVEILPQSEFRGKEYFENFRTEEQRNKCLEFPGSEGCFKDKSAALQNKELPGYARRRLEYLTDLNPDYQYIDPNAITGLTALKTLEQKPLTVKEFDDITGGYGTKILTGQVQNQYTAKILELLDKGEYIKDLYSNYNKNKLTQITDPKTGKLLPTNDPRAQIDLRETMWKRQPTKENRTEGTIDENRQQLGYPINSKDELFWNRNEGIGDLPMRAVKIGVKGLLEEEYILGPNGNLIKNPNYTGKLSEEGKEWVEKATSKYGIDPAVIGYFNQSAMSDSTKTLSDYDPSLLVEWERYSKQPILSVNMEDDKAPVLSWASREPILTKYSPDMEGAVPVTGAIKTGFLDNKKKKKLGGVKDKCYTCQKIHKVKK